MLTDARTQDPATATARGDAPEADAEAMLATATRQRRAVTVADCRVLIVDDFGTVRMVQRQALSELGITDITEASNGADALRLIERDEFDLIVTDWNMPEMTGLELLRQIRYLDSTLPVVLVTTNCDRSEVLAAAREGISAYVVKPFKRTAYQDTISGVLGI